MRRDDLVELGSGGVGWCHATGNGALDQRNFSALRPDAERWSLAMLGA